MEVFRISRARSRALLAVSFVPLLWMATFVSFTLRSALGGHRFLEESWFPIFAGVHFLVALGTYALIGVYVYLAVKRGFAAWQVVLTTIGLFAFNALFFPIAWLLVGRERPEPKFEEHAHGVQSVGF